jgi:predicted ATPase with chaperone activity
MKELNVIDILGQRILKRGLISRDQLIKAIERQRLFGGRIGFNLTAMGLISESDLSSFFTFKPHTLPSNAEETNIGIGFVTDLILKHCVFLKKFNVNDLADRIKLPASLILEIVTELRRDRFIEVAKGDISLAASEYALTDAGINRAVQSLESCRYTGPAPVSLNEYRYAIEIQTIKSVEITYDQLKDAFSKVVLSDDKLKTIGAAINSSKPIFLYGPPGNGKTTIAEFIGHSLPGEIYIPYSVLAGDQVIIVYDQVNHKAIIEKKDDHLDQRWIKIKRPVVIAGGELTLQTLDLSFNSDSKYYEAPLQMKANNGLFIVDDFGRQIIDPQSLLNRWIIPLDRQIDFLTLHTGMKFEIPFDQLVIFATNLPPKKIADEAFLRRLRYKINLDYPTIEEYRQIFKNICDSNYIKYDENVFNHLIQRYEASKRNFSCCDPRDLIDHIIDFASFQKIAPVTTNKSINRAWENYFVV